MEEKDTIMDYLDLLAETGTEYMILPSLKVFREMDRLRNNLGMVSSDLGCAKRGASALAVETEGKGHAQQALSAALEGIAAAREYYGQAEALMVKGAADAVAWFRAGRSNALEKPFPIQAVEQRLESMKKCLENAFIEVDLGIGRTEEAEGMFCYYGHYWKQGSNEPWVDSGGDPALLDVLWPMRSLEMVIRQAYESAHETAKWADCLRPKGRSKFEWVPLKDGYFWEKEKAERMEKQEEAELPGKLPWEEKAGEPAKGKQDEKASLRERLKVAEKNSRLRYYPMFTNERENKVGDMQR